MDRIVPKEEVEVILDPDAPKRCDTPLEYEAPINVLYHYMIQEAILESLLLDGTSIPPSAFAIATNLRSRKFRMPPTYIVHGMRDRMVPVDQSREVVQAFKDIGFEGVEYVELDGLDHLFDMMDPKVEMEDMYEFVLRCVKG